MCVYGWQGKLAIDDTAVDENSTRLHFVSADFPGIKQLVDANNQSISGGLESRAENVRDGNRFPRGRIVLQPRPDELHELLPWFLNNPGDAGTYVPGNTPKSKRVRLEAISDCYDFEEVYVDKFQLFGRAARGEESEQSFIYLVLQVIGKTWTHANSFPDLDLSEQQPYVFTDSALSFDSLSLNPEMISLSGDYGLSPSFFNSLSPTCIKPTRSRMLTLATQTEFTSSVAAKAATHLAASTSGASGSWSLTNGARSMIATFAHLRAFGQTASIEGKSNEVLQPWNWKALATGVTPEVSIVNDSVA